MSRIVKAGGEGIFHTIFSALQHTHAYPDTYTL